MPNALPPPNATPPSLDMLDGSNREVPAAVDWLGWQPAVEGGLFSDSTPESLFLAQVLTHPARTERWSALTGEDRSDWLHALLTVADSSPRSPVVQEAIFALTEYIQADFKKGLHEQTGWWGEKGVAERLLAHHLRNPAPARGGQIKHAPRGLREVAGRISHGQGPLERLAACGHSGERDIRILTNLGRFKPLSAPSAAQARSHEDSKGLNAAHRGALESIEQSLKNGVPVLDTYTRNARFGSGERVFTVDLMSLPGIGIKVFSQVFPSSESVKRKWRSPDGGDSSMFVEHTPLWVLCQSFSASHLAKAKHLLALGASPDKPEGAHRDTAFHRATVAEPMGEEVLDEAQNKNLLIIRLKLLTAMAEAHPKVWTAVDRDHQTALLRAIRRGDEALAAWMITRSPTQTLLTADCLKHSVSHAIVQSFAPGEAQRLLEQINDRLPIDWMAQSQLNETIWDQVGRRPESEQKAWKEVAAHFGQALPEHPQVARGFQVRRGTGTIFPLKPGARAAVPEQRNARI